MFAVVVVTYSAPAATLRDTLTSIISSIPAENSLDETPSDETPSDETPSDETPSDETPSSNTPVIVVDTGGSASVDGLFDQVQVELLRVDNRGYGAAANIGFARARELGATRYILLNDDVVVHPGWIEAMAMELSGDVGAVQPKLLFAGTDRINSLGVKLDAHGAGSDVGAGSPDGPLEPRDIEIFTGGAVMFSDEFLAATGGFDERFMLYYEDVDLALRGRELGWRYRLAPAAVVEHIGGLSTSAQPDHTRFLQERNRLWNSARHGNPATMSRALWLSIRRLRHRPHGVHARALASGLSGMPTRLLERRRASATGQTVEAAG